MMSHTLSGEHSQSGQAGTKEEEIQSQGNSLQEPSKDRVRPGYGDPEDQGGVSA